MENKRDFKGIWIPAEIWLREDLNATEKMVIAEIHSLSNQRQGCYASNNHFAKITGLSTSRCSAIINKLKKDGMLKIEYIYKKDSPKEIERRTMKIDFTYCESETPLSDMKGDPFESEGRGISDMKTPPFEYSEDKVPSTKVPIESTKKKDDKENKVEEPTYKPASFNFYESNGFGTLSSVVIESIFGWINDFKEIGSTDREADEIVTHALKTAVFANVRTWKYTNGTLKNWHNKGLTNIEQVDAAESQRQASFENKSNGNKKTPQSRKETLPDWVDKQEVDEKLSPEEEAEFRKQLAEIRGRKGDTYATQPQR